MLRSLESVIPTEIGLFFNNITPVPTRNDSILNPTIFLFRQLGFLYRPSDSTHQFVHSQVTLGTTITISQQFCQLDGIISEPSVNSLPVIYSVPPYHIPRPISANHHPYVRSASASYNWRSEFYKSIFWLRNWPNIP